MLKRSKTKNLLPLLPIHRFLVPLPQVRWQFKHIRNAKGITLGECIRTYKEKADLLGEGVYRAAPEDEVEPDSDKCVAICKRSATQHCLC
jgi:hypothetical protein